MTQEIRELKKVLDGITSHVKNTVAQCIAAGKLLTQIKSKTKHGDWEDVLESVELNFRTAQRYMALWEHRTQLNLKEVRSITDAHNVVSALSLSKNDTNTIATSQNEQVTEEKSSKNNGEKRSDTLNSEAAPIVRRPNKETKLEEPEILLDHQGYPVPLKIKEAWLTADAIASQQMKLCSDAKAILNKAEQDNDHSFNELNISEALADISAVRFMWKMLQPYAVCTNCQGKTPETCEFCGEKDKGNGKGWISEFRYRTVLPELIAMREKSIPEIIKQTRKEMMRP